MYRQLNQTGRDVWLASLTGNKTTLLLKEDFSPQTAIAQPMRNITAQAIRGHCYPELLLSPYGLSLTTAPPYSSFFSIKHLPSFVFWIQKHAMVCHSMHIPNCNSLAILNKFISLVKQLTFIFKVHNPCLHLNVYELLKKRPSSIHIPLLLSYNC